MLAIYMSKKIKSACYFLNLPYRESWENISWNKLRWYFLSPIFLVKLHKVNWHDILALSFKFNKFFSVSEISKCYKKTQLTRHKIKFVCKMNLLSASGAVRPLVVLFFDPDSDKSAANSSWLYTTTPTFQKSLSCRKMALFSVDAFWCHFQLTELFYRSTGAKSRG